MPLPLLYHTNVSSSLQAVARLANKSPYGVVIHAPLEKALEIAQRQLQRYPSIQTSHQTKTALRKAGYPAVQMVLMVPDKERIGLILLSNIPPENSRENWLHVLDEDWPMTWRNYQLCSNQKGGMTWRLSEGVRAHYKNRIARIITGRGGIPEAYQQPYQLPAETAKKQILKLAGHLCKYPGLSGIRRDVFSLAQYSTKVWKSTHPDVPYPEWPVMPYLPYKQPRLRSLEELLKWNDE